MNGCRDRRSQSETIAVMVDLIKEGTVPLTSPAQIDGVLDPVAPA